MDAVKYIEEHLEARAILEYYSFEQITETDDSLRACCKIHGGNNPTGFVWKKENNLWFCYTGDCHGGDVFNLIQKIENVDFITSVRIAAQILGLSIDGMEINIPESKIRKEQLRWLEKQKHKVSYANCEYEMPYTKLTYTHDNFTRFDEEIIRFYNAGFCNIFPTESGMLKNKLAIPIYDKGTCVGVALRDTTGTFFPKWFYQPKGLKIGKLLYNLDNAVRQESEELVLVEGIFDVWAYHRIGVNNAVAIFGSSISNEQYKTLLRTGKSLVLSFDQDNAGRKCTAKAFELFTNKTELSVIRLPEGKDPADCTKTELLSAYLERSIEV